MRRLLFALAAVALASLACGREGPLVAELASPTPAPPTPTPLIPTLAPLETAPPTFSPSPSSSPTALATPKPTAALTPTPLPTHSPTPTTRPPDAWMRDGGREVKGLLVAYNWKTDDHRELYDAPSYDPPTSFSVGRNDTLTIAFTRTDQPSSVSARYRRSPGKTAPTSPLAIDRHNPATIHAYDLPPGTVWVDVFTYWSQGNATHTFKLVVGS